MPLPPVQTCDVFVGYAGEDRKDAKLLILYLPGLDCWLDSPNVVLFERDMGHTIARI